MKMKKFFKSVVMVCACVLASGMLKAPTYVQAANPYLPLWEHIPDGEPYVFEDPDNPGKERVYIYGSHDTLKTTYCGKDLVVWSAPVENLNDWRYDGVIFESIVNGQPDTLFAPDVAMREENGEKVYYLYPNNQASGRGTMVAKSKSPVGPFEVCNWSDEAHTKTTGCMGFDPAVFVDDDGRVYGYWGFESIAMAELDPETMSSVKDGTEVKRNIIDTSKQETGPFRFFEASSLRKIKDKYVFIYSRKTMDGEDGLGPSNATLAYAYSDHPLGPWTYGGTLVDARAVEKNEKDAAVGTMPGHNTHGSVLEINDKWYVFYHRATNNDGYARQATAEQVEVKVTEGKIEEGGKVEISKAEVTSQGFETDGLNPYEKHSSGIASFFYNDKNIYAKGYIKATYDKRVDGNPVIRNKDGGIVGYKYFNFDGGPKEGQTTRLSIDVLPKGNDGTMEIWLDRPWESQGGKKIGTIAISKDDPLRQIQKQVELPELDRIDGKHAVFFKFSTKSSGEICDLYDFVFENAEVLAENVNKNSWNIENGNPVISGSSLTLKNRDALSMADGKQWDNYLVSQTVSVNNGTLSVRVRKADDYNYYEARIQNGAAALYTSVNGKSTILAQAETDIKSATDTKISVNCVDSSISVRVNDEVVLKVNDSTHKKGTAGYAFTGDGSAAVNEIHVEASGKKDEVLITEGIRINGEVYGDFNADIKEYVCPMKKGSQVPTVEAFTNDPGTRISVAQAEAFPGAAVVRFEGSSERTYVFKFIEEIGEDKEITWGNALPAEWEVINPEGSGKTQYNGGSLTICGVSGPDYPNTKNILQMKEKLTGNWEVTVKCDLAGEFGDTLYAQYGIGLRGNSGQIKADVEQQWKGGFQARFSGVNGGVGAGNGKSGYLRVRRLGGRLEALFSSNGTDYKSIGTRDAQGYEEPRIQLFVAPQGRTEQFDVTFSEMKISHLPDEVSADKQLEDITAAENIAAFAEAGIIIPKANYADDNAKAQAAIEVIKKSGIAGAENASYEIKDRHGCPCLVITAGTAIISIQPLEIRESGGKQALLEMIGQIESLDRFIYTKESWQRLENLLTAARQAAVNGSETDIARMEEYLDAGIDLLEERPPEELVNRNALIAAIERTKNLKATDYTATTWKALQYALNTATDARDSEVDQVKINEATAALRKALEGLIWVDKSGLRAAIARAGERKEADYTATSWKVMQDALKEAQTVEANADAVQKQIDDATFKLSEALRNLETKSTVNKNALSAAIARTENLKESDYTATSWKAVQDALKIANEAMAGETVTQNEVNAATAALRKALEDLVRVDKSGLRAAIDRANERKEEDYTDKPDEWAAMQAELAEATKVEADADAVQKEVDDATYKLSEALRALDKEGTINKNALSAAVERTKKLSEADYTATSWGALQDALERASEAMESGTATQEEVNEATAALRKALGELVWVDKSGLRAAIDRAGERREADYTAASWAAMQEVLATAKAVAENEDSIQKEVDDAAFELSEALRNLEAKSGANKDALGAAIDRTKNLEETDYTKTTWKVLQEALKTATGAMESEAVSQEEVNAATAGLREALEALVRVDKSGLKAAIDRANARKEADYIKESWATMQAALVRAKTVAENGDAVQKEVDDATYELSEALRNLKYAEPEKEDLNSALNAANALRKEDYTPAAWEAFQKVLANAEAIFNNPKATKEQRAAAAASLKKAVEEVKKNPAGNITPPTVVKVNKISISGLSKKIAAGRKIQLTAKISPSNAANKDVIWESSNKKVATVDSRGVVTMKKKSGGKSVTITATAKDGSKVKATYKIRSMKGKVTKVTISGKKTVKAGKTLKLTGKVKATKNANKKLKWTSSNKKYATVTSSGKVKALKAGKGKRVKITAMATDGSGRKKTVTIKITK